MKRLKSADIAKIEDGTWIETDQLMTKVLRTWHWNEPRPAGAPYLWRQKQLVDQLQYAEYLESQRDLELER